MQPRRQKMNSQNQNGKINPFKSNGQGCFSWLVRIVLSITVLALVGAVYELIAEAADAKAYPPPGQLVNVDGHRMHINCVGTGSPTVVIEAGLGDWSTSWAGSVQPEVAKTTRVCTYDRAGLGWSEATALPSDAEQFAGELHTLLHNSNVPGPYVMVGHSLGGLIVRVFAHDYASEVAGVVLVDSMNPRQITKTMSNRLALVSSVEAALARVGVARMIVKLPAIASSVRLGEEAYYPLFSRPTSFQTAANEYRALPASGAEAAAVTSFGDVPLIVLTAKLNDNPGWAELQKELLQLSSHSEQIFAENSGHVIQSDQPDAAVSAILKMVELVRH